MKHLPKILLFLSLSINCFFLHAQTNQQDSIKISFDRIKELIENKDRYRDDFATSKFLLDKMEKTKGKEKVNVLLKLCILNEYENIDLAKKYNREALELSKNIGDKQGEYKARYKQAYLSFIQGDFYNSMGLIQEIEKIISYEKFPETFADLKTLKSDIHTEKGEYDKALETGLNLLDTAEKTNNEYILMKAHAALSHYYLRIENYKKSLSHCLGGLDYLIKDRQVHILFQKVDEIARMSAKLNNINGALEAYSFYLEMEKKVYPPGSYIQSIVYMNMADIYMVNGELTKAQDYLSQALTMNFENNYRFRIPRALILQAELHLKNGDTTNAILNYEKSIEAAENIDAFDVIKSNSLVLVDLYEKVNEPSKVYEYKTLHKAIKDSLFTNEKEQRIIILETRRKIKEVTQKQKILELENVAHQAKLNTITTILTFILIITAFVIFSYVKVKEKNKLLYRRTIELAEIQLKIEDDNQKKKIQKKKALQKNLSQKTNTSIDSNIKDIILDKLEKLEEENFFIDSNCNLHQLSEKLKTNSKYLSQVINQEKGSNFNNYINELRINYLLGKLLKDKEFRNSKLSYIAVSVGYNNLNTFNAAFKKRQGILPSYFINELNNESNINESKLV
ncbi:AraC-like DNA-binding protein [Saonia flava]|uniref:AraC-like DNA-binding protein n=1 Tax=Saonia flava TaxID=523696 RepID=A0A846QYD9_9FLAO|nr:helix-turn-helix domain-containing protein [Saonia flava]NJB71940.1 AraC-like DNA-binding protein [Saonia flava]